MDYFIRHGVALLLLCAAAMTWGQGPTTPPAARTLGQQITALRQQYQLPAVTAAIVRADGVETAVTGVRKAGGTELVQMDDRWHLGSDTKAMTATMIAVLVQEGKLTWQSTPAQLLPEVAATMNPAYRTVTLTQLLSHRSGLPAFTTGEAYEGIPPFSGPSAVQRRLFAQWVLSRPPAVPQGQFLYSNADYAVATAMAEAVSGQDWQTLMQTPLFQLLDITGSFGWPASTDPRNPWGHIWQNNAFVPQDPHGDYVIPPFVAPAGDVSMSIGDYAVFVQMHLRGLQGQTGLLLPPAVFTTLHTPPRQDAETYALGWGIRTINGVATSMHEGSGGTFDAFVYLQPQRNIGVVIITNAAGNEPARQGIMTLAEQLLRL